jgi:hypothetical protein
LKSHFNIILQPINVSSKWSHALESPHQNLCAPLLCPIHATRPNPAARYCKFVSPR